MKIAIESKGISIAECGKREREQRREKVREAYYPEPRYVPDTPPVPQPTCE